MKATIDELRSLIVPGDLHLIFSPQGSVCTVWRRTVTGGQQIFSLPMINRAVNEGDDFRGHCPPGSYLLGAPSNCHVVSLGEHFTPLFDLDPNGPMHEHGRVGIGIHGGGTGLPDPFAPMQELIATLGCFRIHNRDNSHLVIALRSVQAIGRKCYFTRNAE